jgi:hypothetical protein
MRKHLHQTRLSVLSFSILPKVFRGALRALYPGSFPGSARGKHPLVEPGADSLLTSGSLPVSLVFDTHSWAFAPYSGVDQFPQGADDASILTP